LLVKLMLIPLNNTIPSIATISKKIITSGFCESRLLCEINVRTSLATINKLTRKKSRDIQ
jgi:hypothetical protein